MELLTSMRFYFCSFFSVFDAWGKPTPGVLQGSFKWLGAYDQCIALMSPTYNQTSNNNTDMYQFVGKYCNVLISPAQSKEGNNKPSPQQQFAAAAANVCIFIYFSEFFYGWLQMYYVCVDLC